MKEEIKEILDDLLFTTTLPDVSVKLSEEKLNQLKDYITNLQEEVNKLTAESTEWESKCYDLQKENERLKEENKHIFSKVNDDELLISNAMNYTEAQEYKQRIEEAIDYIENEYEKNIIITDYADNPITPQEEYGELLNILKGDKDE